MKAEARAKPKTAAARVKPAGSGGSCSIRSCFQLALSISAGGVSDDGSATQWSGGGTASPRRIAAQRDGSRAKLGKGT
eukprot:1157358-Prymnesium_polylepis.1